jgi:hypothetical protein
MAKSEYFFVTIPARMWHPKTAFPLAVFWYHWGEFYERTYPRKPVSTHNWQSDFF